MSLNAKDVKGNGTVQEPVDPGSYPARLVQVIDLGLQPQEYQGETKKPAQEIAITHELLDEFIKDENGEEVKDKPRWLTEIFPLYNLSADKAKSTARYFALDPDSKYDGDWTKLLGATEVVTVVTNAGKGKNKGKFFSNVVSTSTMRAKDAEKAPGLINKPKSFDLSKPDIELFMSLPKFLQDRIKANLEYGGSDLEALVAGYIPKDKAETKSTKKAEVVEEEPAEDDTGNW